MGQADTIEPERQHTAMTPADMNQLIEEHLAAEIAGDTDRCVAM